MTLDILYPIIAGGVAYAWGSNRDEESAADTFKAGILGALWPGTVAMLVVAALRRYAGAARDADASAHHPASR